MHIGHRRRPAAAFTLLELIIVVLVLAIISAMAMGALSSADAAQRADRAARECITALRAARTRAVTTGRPVYVRVEPATGRISVCDQATNQPIGESALGGAYAYTLSGRGELAGTTVRVGPTNQTTDFVFSRLGDCSTEGTIDFVYAGRHATVAVARLGDPLMGGSGAAAAASGSDADNGGADSDYGNGNGNGNGHADDDHHNSGSGDDGHGGGHGDGHDD